MNESRIKCGFRAFRHKKDSFNLNKKAGKGINLIN